MHYKNVIGTPVFTIPYAGYIANYIQNPPGRYFAIAGGLILLALVFLPDLLDDDNGNTGILIEECTYQKDKAPKGYALTVEIIASGIQSKPASVFNTEWASSGLKVNDSGNALVESNNK